MALTLTQQIADRMVKGQRHLVVFRALEKPIRIKTDGDAIAASLALARFLRAQGVTVDIVSHGFAAPRVFAFLEGIHDIAPSLARVEQCRIELNVRDCGIRDVASDVRDGMLTITLTPERGAIDPTRIAASLANDVYDCIWIIDTQDWNALGAVYLEHTDLFHRTTTVVIDHNNANEQFGSINVVDNAANATSEVIFSLCENIAAKDIDASLATTLLTGIIAKTKGLRSSMKHPRILSAVHTLMQRGANRDAIVDALYRQRTMGTLKLWGDVLTRLQQDTAHHLAYASIPYDAFVRAGAHPDDLPMLIDDLMSSAPEAKTILLLFVSPDDNLIHGMLHTNGTLDARELAAAFSPRGTQDLAYFRVDAPTLLAAQDEALRVLMITLAHYI